MRTKPTPILVPRRVFYCLVGFMILFLLATAIWVAKRIRPAWFRLSLINVAQLPSELARAAIAPEACPSRAFQKVDEPELVLIGDSLIEHGPWSDALAPVKVLNLGISRDTSDCLLYRLGQVAQIKPKHVVLLVGINDLLDNRSVDVVSGVYWLILAQLHRSLPQTKVIVVSLLPVNAKECWFCRVTQKTIGELNQRLEKMTRELGFHLLDLASHLSTTDGELRAEFTTDGLHLNSQGYAVFSQAIKESLAGIRSGAQ